MSDDGKRILQSGKRLSESLLWWLQRNFFKQMGPQAWAKEVVPYYITSNAWIADAYAKVVLGWLRDCAGMLDPDQPVTLLELGCGSGRFGYLFFQRLLDLLGRSSLRQVKKVRYVMTDFTESTLDPLRRHELLQPWIEQGILDFARYDASTGGEIRLAGSGEVLGPGTLRNPLAVIANYVFDGIPQDVFAVRGGRLCELLATLTIPTEEGPGDATMIQRVALSWEERPAAPEPYGDPELDAILREYAERLPDTVVLFPSAAIRCLRHLTQLADGRLLLIAGDKGYCREELLAGRGEPVLAVHGSFSLMVDFHALGRWIVHHGGEFLCASRVHSSLCVVAGVLGTDAVETALAFDDAINRRGPDDFSRLREGFGHAWDDLTPEGLLAWVRLSGWDANVLLDAWPALMKQAASASSSFRQEIHRMVHEVWSHYFPLQEGRDLPFFLGSLLREIGCHADALPYFHKSAAAYGPDPTTIYNIGLCLYHMGRLEEAREQVDQALESTPDLAPALELREEIAAALKEKGP